MAVPRRLNGLGSVSVPRLGQRRLYRGGQRRCVSEERSGPGPLKKTQLEDVRAASRHHKRAILGPKHWASHPETPIAADDWQ